MLSDLRSKDSGFRVKGVQGVRLNRFVDDPSPEAARLGPKSVSANFLVAAQTQSVSPWRGPMPGCYGIT